LPILFGAELCDRGFYGGGLFLPSLQARGESWRSGARAGFIATDPESVARRRNAARKTAKLQFLAARLKAAENAVLTLSRANMQGLADLRRNAGIRLSVLHAGAYERFPGESELCWQALRFAADHEARACAAYLVAAFAGEKDRALFALYPHQREPIVDRVLEEGGLRADRDRWVELVL